MRTWSFCSLAALAASFSKLLSFESCSPSSGTGSVESENGSVKGAPVIGSAPAGAERGGERDEVSVGERW